MSKVLQDTRFASRSLRRSPVFALTAVLTLGCGIGLTAAMCGLARQALLAPLPYAEPGRLVALDFNFPREQPSTNQMGTAAEFLRQHSRSFASFGVADGGDTGVNLAVPGTGPGHAATVQQLRVSRDWLPTLGIQPVLGRGFTQAEDTAGGPRAALLSYALWQSHFGGDPNVVGRLLRIDEEEVPVVGVLPQNAVADLIGDTREAPAAGLFQPRQMSPHDPGYDGTNYQMIARLRDGVSLEQARAELETLLPRFAQENAWYSRWRGDAGELNHLRIWPLQTALAGDVRASLLALLGAAVAVLLVACLNLAGLMVARTAARTRELAVRSALGASRASLMRLVLAESALLGLAGAAMGSVLAHMTIQAFLAYAPVQIANANGSLHMGPLLAFGTALGLAATLLCGLLPALVVVRREVNAGLRHAGSQGQSAAYQRTGRALIVAQVTLAFVLLMAASLLLQTFLKMVSVRPGVDAAHVTIGQVTLKGDAYANTAKTARFTEQVVERLQHTAGVAAAGAVNGLPLDRGLNISGWPADRRELHRSIEARFVSPTYMNTLGIPLLQGRGISQADGADAPRVAIINQAAAKRWWPKGDAIGSRLNMGSEAEYEIVGIAADTHERSLLEQSRILVYVPLPQITDRFMRMINNWFPTTFVVRASEGVNAAAAIQDAVSQADAELPLSRVATMQSVVDQTVATPKFFGWLSSSFALFTLLLAALGLFGLLSYQVTQRTREIGVRMALGANRMDVVGGFMRRGLVLTGLGLAIGAGLSLLLPKLLAGVLPEFRTATALMQQIEAGLFAASLLFAAAAAASLLPAARAARLEPVQALRTE